MTDREANIFKLWNLPQHRFYGEITLLPQLKYICKISAHFQASFTILKKDNHTRYCRRE